MIVRRLLLTAVVAAFAAIAVAENAPPREIWAQAASAAASGDIATAVAKTNELFVTGKGYGIITYPAYATSAAVIARIADRTGKKEVATWAGKASRQLDPGSASVSFMLADRAHDQGNWSEAIKLSLEGIEESLVHQRTRLLARNDLLITLALAIALTAIVFAISLFLRYGHAMAHDFREFLAVRMRGGVVSVFAFALLFLPLFFWFGPMWLLLYWFVIFFGYGNVAERVTICILCVALALLPIVCDAAAAQIAGIDHPIVQAAMLSREQAYRPEALRRVEEFAAIVSDADVVHLLLGNLQLQEGNEQQAQIQYSRAAELQDSAGAHVNLGDLHFLNNDFAAAINEYERAEKLDPKLAIAFYDSSLANGELYHFDDQGRELEQAKKLDRAAIERLTQNPPPQKIMLYTPPLSQAWDVATSLARHGAAQTIFGTYAFFDPASSALNPVTLGSILALLLAIAGWQWRRKTGFAHACIKCGRTFCSRCKSARESATYCTQCIHIYLKRDGVSLETKKKKLEEVHDHLTGTARRNKIIATLVPGSGQIIEGRTLAGAIGAFVFLFFLALALLVGHLAPAIGPVGTVPRLILRSVTIALAVITWFVLSIPVYTRKTPTS